MEQCPQCNGRRLRATREERDLAVDGVLYTGFVKVVACKTCRAVQKNEAEEEAFVRAARRVATGEEKEGEEPHKVRRRR